MICTSASSPDLSTIGSNSKFRGRSVAFLDPLNEVRERQFVRPSELVRTMREQFGATTVELSLKLRVVVGPVADGDPVLLGCLRSVGVVCASEQRVDCDMLGIGERVL